MKARTDNLRCALPLAASRIKCACVSDSRSRKRRGFTFVELRIGMVVVSMVLGALAMFSLATADAWKAGASTNSVGNGQTVASIPIIAALASTRLDNELSNAQFTGGYYAGSLTTSTGQQSSILLWKGDTNADNNTVDASEVFLIEYDATDHVIYKYVPSASTASPADSTAFLSTNYITTFKSTATRTPLARNVDGMQIYVQTPTSSTQMPLVEYRLYFKRGGYTQTRYGATCLRSPTTPYGLILS